MNNSLKLSLAAAALTGQLASADNNSKLEQALAANNISPSVVVIKNTTSQNVQEAIDNNSTTLNNQDYLKSLRFYGTGGKSDDESYSGVGFEYDDDMTDVGAETGDDYTKAFLSRKFNINSDFYTKLGLGYLTKEELIQGNTKDVEQITFGGAAGYGEKDYNFEAGYYANKLSGALDADTTTKTYYAEASGIIHTEIGQFEAIASYKNTKAYDKHYDNYTANLAYYPLSDIRAGVKYDSIEHDEDNFRALVGINYKFADFKNFNNGKYTPYASISKNISKNVSATLEYREDIAYKSLQSKDVFEDAMSTSSLVAKQVEPTEFAAKTAKKSVDNSAPANTAPTINGINYVDDNANSITQNDTISLSATIGDEDVNSVTWKVIEKSTDGGAGGGSGGASGTILSSGTGQFTGYTYVIGNIQGGTLETELEVTDNGGLVKTIPLINQAIQ